MAEAVSEPLRLLALRRTGLLDGGGDPSLDRLARVAAVAVGAPIGLVSLVDQHRQYFAGQTGLADPLCDVRETPLSHSFCKIVVREGKPLVVDDAPSDGRVAGNLAIPDLGVQAYAGMPLVDANGQVLGSLCVIDTVPRTWTSDELALLRDVAAAVEAELRYRLELQEATAQLALLTDITTALHAQLDIDAALKALTDRVVPALAELCTVDLLTGDERHLRMAAIAAADPDVARTVERLEAAVPRRANPGSAVNRVLAGGAGELIDVSSAVLDDLRLPPEHRASYDRLRLQSAVVVPIDGSRGRVGVLSLIRLGISFPQHEGDLRLAEEIGRRVGIAVENAWLFTREHRNALALQRGLLPRIPQQLPGLRLAARFQPNDVEGQVGGDWYDVLPLADGQTGIAIGDVEGHDTSAAATMGQLRAVLRSYAFEGHRPGEVLDRTSRLSREVQERRTATIAYGVLSAPEPDGARTFTYGNAGHPPPLLLLPDGTCLRLTGALSPLIGIDVPGRPNATVVLPPGSTLLLYTDGLVERPTEVIDVGIDAAAQVLTAGRHRSLDEIADELLVLAGDRPADDVALLLVRTEVSGGYT